LQKNTHKTAILAKKIMIFYYWFIPSACRTKPSGRSFSGSLNEKQVIDTCFSGKGTFFEIQLQSTFHQ